MLPKSIFQIRCHRIRSFESIRFLGITHSDSVSAKSRSRRLSLNLVQQEAHYVTPLHLGRLLVSTGFVGVRSVLGLTGMTWVLQRGELFINCLSYGPAPCIAHLYM